MIILNSFNKGGLAEELKKKVGKKIENDFKENKINLAKEGQVRSKL